MPALIRTMAMTGAVLYASYSFIAVPAQAQIPPAPTAPAVSAVAVPSAPTPAPVDSIPAPAPVPAAATDSSPAPAPAINTPTMGTPAATPPAPASTKATTTHKNKVKHASKKHKTATKPVAKKNKGNTEVREAQGHLTNLGYYKDTIDGLIGPKTRYAIRKFQHDHKLRVDGKLSKATYAAIVEADKGNPLPAAAAEKPSESISIPSAPEMAPIPKTVPPPPDFYAKHPDFYGHYDQQFENALQLGPEQTLYSRFARIDLTEDSRHQGEAIKLYTVMLNGLPLVLVDGQPSVVGVSRTFVMGDEDVILFTSYRDHDPVCAYDHNLLILSSDGTRSRSIHNCTRTFKANLTKGGLFVTFPEQDDNRDVGATWRYEKGDLERL